MPVGRQMSQEEITQEELEKQIADLELIKEHLEETEAGLTQQDKDIRNACEEDMATFLRHAWKYIDPSEYIHGWHIDCITDHLMAQSRGELRHLLINIPPRCAKSLLVSVAYAPWIWAQKKTGPLLGPDKSFLYASYAQTLSHRDSLKSRRLIQSPWYQKLWGHRFILSEDQNTKGRFSNDKGGYRIATSVGGQLTGDGGNFLCLTYDQKICTNIGNIEIGKIIDNKLNVKVLSFNHDTRTTEWDDIESFQINPKRQILEIETQDGKTIKCTEDHEIFVVGKGYIFAKDVREEDEVIILDGMSV